MFEKLDVYSLIATSSTSWPCASCCWVLLVWISGKTISCFFWGRSMGVSVTSITVMTGISAWLSKAFFPFKRKFPDCKSIFSVLFTIRHIVDSDSSQLVPMWKYVPVYKRLYVNVRWLLRDLKFQKFKTFPERLTKVLETFLLTPHLSFVCKLRRFTHTFVFRNYKKSLLKTLKATS